MTVENSRCCASPLLLFGLPDEILVHIVIAIGALGDMAALAATCHKMASLWRDDSTWRLLFARDYAHLYKTGVASMSWYPGAHVYAPWPEDAARFWREIMQTYEPGTCLDGMAFGPDTPYDARIPSPFAHMSALGKDWKWLYASHCPFPTDRGPSRASGAHTMVDAKHMPPGTVTATYRGDLSPTGRPDGYGVGFYADAAGSVTHFVQSMWRDGYPVGWQTLVSPNSASSHTVHGRAARIAYVVLRSGMRIWGKAKGNSMSGPAFICSIDGSRARCVFKAGMFFCGTRFYQNGESISDWRGVLTSREDDVDRLANGDVFLYARDNGKSVGVKWFRCSMRSPHADYAGRTLSNISWRLIRSEWSDGGRGPVYVPAHDCDTDDARAFWRYVRLEQNGIGWDQRARRIALEACPTNGIDLAPS
ncbi:F-box domain-containing protein [Pandoravirus kuranda]|uniref:F-box domain-containing protein n=1 Tax=Pandoravirus kuranda TaxID=3019033 RepID=A0AA95EE57_9VIRU|nr:F-box domain-containing protein [Pandoravirus kuranda]